LEFWLAGKQLVILGSKILEVLLDYQGLGGQWGELAQEVLFMMLAIIKLPPFNEEMPAGINATDPYEHIHTIWEKGVAGDYGVIAEYVPPEIPPIPEVVEEPPVAE
jgi:hypothetical protein